VVAIYGHPEASKLAYLSLYALQHRGQESAGIAASDGEQLRLHKSMGLVSDIFTADVLARVPGSLAIGHTRYSTTGDSALLNAQPIMVECNKGKIALAHNGNITNALEVRAQLDQQGSIFQTTSDTEVIVHLIARSREETLAGRHGRFAAPPGRRVFAGHAHARSGFRSARSPGLPAAGNGPHFRQEAHRADTIVFASETCAFDLIGATMSATSSRASGHRWARRECIRASTRRSSRNRAASSSMCISRGPTAWSSDARCSSRATPWAASLHSSLP
jgi:amidophosphoribosyltransferase